MARWCRCARVARGDEGASAVEFALVLPVLVLLIFGMVEFGLAYNAYITVNHAANEGARMASVGRFSAAEVKARAAGPVDPANLSVGAPVSSVGANGEDRVSVTVSYPYTLRIPLMGEKALTLRSTATMREE